MKRENGELLIRNVTVDDAEQLCKWWNDGNVMAHAGFPNGLGTTAEAITHQIEKESDQTTRRHIIEFRRIPIGEMNYRNMGGKVCEIGIKICNSEMQNVGLGKKILTMFIDALFTEFGYEIIILDTNLKNMRAQNVYAQLGFQKVRINIDAWKDQLGNMQSSVDYKLTERQFVRYL